MGRGLIGPDMPADDEKSVTLILEERYQGNALVEGFASALAIRPESTHLPIRGRIFAGPEPALGFQRIGAVEFRRTIDATGPAGEAQPIAHERFPRRGSQ